jgi:hypothetical protein
MAARGEEPDRISVVAEVSGVEQREDDPERPVGRIAQGIVRLGGKCRVVHVSTTVAAVAGSNFRRG